jgi:hypothetical protein
MQRLRNHREGIAEALESDRDALDSGLAACAALATIAIVANIERVDAGDETHCLIDSCDGENRCRALLAACERLVGHNRDVSTTVNKTKICHGRDTERSLFSRASTLYTLTLPRVTRNRK